MTGLTPISLKIQEVVDLYYAKIRNRYDELNIDHTTQYKSWTHPAEFVEIKETRENRKYKYEIFTDGSKSEHGVGARVAIFNNKELKHQLRFKLPHRCSNNQAEQLGIYEIAQY